MRGPSSNRKASPAWRVGDTAAYGFVLINMLAQPRIFGCGSWRGCGRRPLVTSCPTTHSPSRRRASARQKSSSATEHTPRPTPSYGIRSHASPKTIRRLERGRDSTSRKWRRWTGELLARSKPSSIHTAYRPTTWWVCRRRRTLWSWWHQPPKFRLAVLPKLKANVDAGQAEPGTYAMVYDRTQRDQGKNQLYAQQLECTSGKALDVAPIDDAKNVNVRRAALGLMRLELYARLVRLNSPDLCGSTGTQK